MTAPRPDPSILARHVLDALGELVDGLSIANAAARDRPLDAAVEGDARHVSTGMVAVVLRVVLLLFVEDMGFLPAELRGRGGLRGLHAELRSRPPASPGPPDGDAWQRLLDVSRFAHDRLGGASRAGNLFDPERWPFLEGRTSPAPHADALRPLAVPDATVQRALDLLLLEDGEPMAYGSMPIERFGEAYEALLGLRVVKRADDGALCLAASEDRRRSGAHYTSPELTRRVVGAALAPLLAALGEAPRPEQILALSVCDPAMGGGAFLVEACRCLSAPLVRAYDAHGRAGAASTGGDLEALAAAEIAVRCLYGVDADPVAVDVARLSLWLLTLARREPLTFVDQRLRLGDALIGLTRQQISAFDWAPDEELPLPYGPDDSIFATAAHLRAHAAGSGPSDRDARASDADLARRKVRTAADVVMACFFASDDRKQRRRLLDVWRPRVRAWLQGGDGEEEIARFVGETLCEGGRRLACFHWPVELPEIFGAGGGDVGRGFRAIVGNPPWVSYAGRAAQPLSEPRRAFYLASYAGFAGYRNLQGLFVERAATLLSPGGRLGFVLPSSMAELAGYGPTRAAHHRLAVCDDELPDLGEGSFSGVFQPSMILLSTARAAPALRGDAAPWPIERPDVDDEAAELLRKFGLRALPPHLFGERGLQTMGDDVLHLTDTPDDHHSVPMRVGKDIRAFERGAPSMFADPEWFGARLRHEDWRAVRLLIRQTARVPTAVLSDGVGFRNSILAGFEDDEFPATFLVAYLAATPVRWHHYYRNRDARLGMPQVKIGHLRATPAPPPEIVAPLAAIGARLSARNTGITEEERSAIDAIVAEAFGLEPREVERVRRDAAAF